MVVLKPSKEIGTEMKKRKGHRARKDLWSTASRYGHWLHVSVRNSERVALF